MPDLSFLLQQALAGQGYQPGQGFGVQGQYPNQMGLGSLFFDPSTDSQMVIKSPPAVAGAGSSPGGQGSAPPAGGAGQPQGQQGGLSPDMLTKINLLANIGSVLSGGQNSIMGQLGGYTADFTRNLIFQNMLKSLIGSGGIGASGGGTENPQ